MRYPFGQGYYDGGSERGPWGKRTPKDDPEGLSDAPDDYSQMWHAGYCPSGTFCIEMNGGLREDKNGNFVYDNTVSTDMEISSLETLKELRDFLNQCIAHKEAGHPNMYDKGGARYLEYCVVSYDKDGKPYWDWDKGPMKIGKLRK